MQYDESGHWKLASFIYLFIILRDSEIYPFHGLEKVGALEKCEYVLVS